MRERAAAAAGKAPGRYQISPRSAPCTPPPATYAIPTGRRSSPYPQLVRLDPRRSSPSTGPSRSPAPAARRWRAAVDRLRTSWPPTAYHATRADLLRRLGCSQKSRAAYDKAIELAGNTAEIAYLTRRRDQLG